MSSFELSPGVVIDTDRSEAYVMSPTGGIVALDLAAGSQVWHSTDAAKPLAVSGDLLISQAETAGPNNELAIVALNTRQGGATRTRSLVELPPGVQPAINRSANRAFTAQAQPLAADDAAVSWEFVARPLRGMASGPLEVLPEEAGPPDVLAGALPGATARGASEAGSDVVVSRGAARVGLGDGAVTPMGVSPPGAVRGARDAPPAAAPDLAPETPIPGLPEPQFLSADGRHVLISTKVGDDKVWDKYLWTIHERSGARLGEIRAHVRSAPFFVSGTQVVYQTEPYARRVGAELVEEPVRIRAVDLQTGAQSWSHAIRDITDRDAPPP